VKTDRMLWRTGRRTLSHENRTAPSSWGSSSLRWNLLKNTQVFLFVFLWYSGLNRALHLLGNHSTF
jgi:hypothetical protein